MSLTQTNKNVLYVQCSKYYQTFRSCDIKNFKLKYFTSYLSPITRVNFKYHKQFTIFATRMRTSGINHMLGARSSVIRQTTNLEMADIQFENVSLVFGGFGATIVVAFCVALYEYFYFHNVKKATIFKMRAPSKIRFDKTTVLFRKSHNF